MKKLTTYLLILFLCPISLVGQEKEAKSELDLIKKQIIAIDSKLKAAKTTKKIEKS